MVKAAEDAAGALGTSLPAHRRALAGVVLSRAVLDRRLAVLRSAFAR